VDTPLERYQDEIYVAGAAGATPILPANLDRLDEMAQRAMTPHAYGYVAGSAGTEDTAAENRRAFARWRIVPRMLTDVSQPSYASTVLGLTLPSPFLLGPIGVLGIAHPGGECAVARAGASEGVPMVLSTASTTPIEDVAAASGDGQRWYQLYWPKDRSVAVSLLSRAKASGFTALVVTLDTRMLAWRPRDLDNGYLPFIRGLGTQVYMSDPAFQAGLDRPVDEDPVGAFAHYAQMFGDTSLTWSDLPFLREHWDGPILLKGIQSVADASKAADAGMDGIIVSNHGGRQVDGAIGALEPLPAIAAAVGDRLTVLFDSGIRCGSDIIKALALGAKAVLIARPYAFGLGIAGEDGVRHVIRALRADFELTMRIAGFATLADLTPEVLVRQPS
jgi:isopentenyl diphosphate isomerase/L-lactate dehydrogenase-like FMN-dependent dehydrogenase